MNPGHNLALKNYLGHTISAHVRPKTKSDTEPDKPSVTGKITLASNKTKETAVTLAAEQVYLKFTSLFSSVLCVLAIYITRQSMGLNKSGERQEERFCLLATYSKQKEMNKGKHLLTMLPQRS